MTMNANVRIKTLECRPIGKQLSTALLLLSKNAYIEHYEKT